MRVVKSREVEQKRFGNLGWMLIDVISFGKAEYRPECEMKKRIGTYPTVSAKRTNELLSPDIVDVQNTNGREHHEGFKRVSHGPSNASDPHIKTSRILQT